jgi:quinolinate synthase
LETLQGIISGKFINKVEVDPEIVDNANSALQRMIDWSVD